MTHRTAYRCATLAAVLCLAASLLAQNAPQQSSPSQSDSVSGSGTSEGAAAPKTENDPLAQLTSEQRDTYDRAVLLAKERRFSEVVKTLRPVLMQLTLGTPVQINVAKYAAEAAINVGDYEFAESLLKPIETADPNDWKRLVCWRAFMPKPGGNNFVIPNLLI